jgi:hypothetical protein
VVVVDHSRARLPLLVLGFLTDCGAAVGGVNCTFANAELVSKPYRLLGLLVGLCGCSRQLTRSFASAGDDS